MTANDRTEPGVCRHGKPHGADCGSCDLYPDATPRTGQQPAKPGSGEAVKKWINNKPTRLFSTWRNMMSRCTNPSNREYQRYGARGITVCDRWLNSFESFAADMGDKPEGMTLERIDNEGPYAPWNCRWATPSEQRLNQRPGTLNEVTINGVTLHIREWTRRLSIDNRTVHARISRGMSPIDALLKPARKYTRVSG